MKMEGKGREFGTRALDIFTSVCRHRFGVIDEDAVSRILEINKWNKGEPLNR